MHARTSNKKGVVGEFQLRGPNSRLEPLRLRWKAPESLYYGGGLSVVGGPEGLKARFEKRISDISWLKNNPNHVAGGRRFTENFYATVAVLMAFAEVERLMFETVHSPVPNTQTNTRAQTTGSFVEDDFERSEGTPDPEPQMKPRIAGTINTG